MRFAFQIPKKHPSGKQLSMTILNQSGYGSCVTLKTMAIPSRAVTVIPAIRFPTRIAIHTPHRAVALQRITTTPRTQFGYRATCWHISSIVPRKSAGIGWTTALKASTAITRMNASPIPATIPRPVLVAFFTEIPFPTDSEPGSATRAC